MPDLRGTSLALDIKPVESSVQADRTQEAIPARASKPQDEGVDTVRVCVSVVVGMRA